MQTGRPIVALQIVLALSLLMSGCQPTATPQGAVKGRSEIVAVTPATPAVIVERVVAVTPAASAVVVERVAEVTATTARAVTTLTLTSPPLSKSTPTPAPTPTRTQARALKRTPTRTPTPTRAPTRTPTSTRVPTRTPSAKASPSGTATRAFDYYYLLVSVDRLYIADDGDSDPGDLYLWASVAERSRAQIVDATVNIYPFPNGYWREVRDGTTVELNLPIYLRLWDNTPE